MSRRTPPRMAGAHQLLLDLPDLVAAVTAAGGRVEVPDPGTEHGRALYETLGVDVVGRPTVEAMIEAVRLPRPRFAAWLDGWRALRSDGWDVTVLLDRSERHVVALACRPLLSPSAPVDADGRQDGDHDSGGNRDQDEP